ncbi:RagB/SusD family nutrient uptake outer membrane protein [Parapedobacter koreensis]|uniref:Starch-binding associating with outer membrane n=1 Tax=Parapedobacter koreensis TaxID=332977 RepID=A0A1H7K0H8_9SPHI|nr:RagB/SusD family nutrient uptake outer membrane protein [Parapedobacter koreensis]SEK79920.1 Starch-binding associating with outer membrane [Parapedobacter koreensis]
MKHVIYFLLIAVSVLQSACRDNLLDVDPVTMLTKDQIYASPEGVTAYFASLYRDMPIEDYTFCNGRFGEFPANGDSYTANWTEEAFAYGTRNSQLNAENWGKLYSAIRNVNTFLEEIATVTNVDEPTKARYTAEARFVRAYYYFALVKFWGGVPILTGPALDPGPLRNQPRNLETEVWDFIKEDLDFAAANLPAESPYGRANKYVALGLLSRAMLHAGSIGKFGTVQLNGVIGVDAAKATEYLQSSYAASRTIITDGYYHLFNQYPTDKIRNFQYLFYECKPGDQNPEAIFAKGFDFASTQSTHSQDLMVLPDYIRSPDGYANRLQPTLDFVEQFEYRDGTPGALDIGTPSNYVHHSTLGGPFENKDPRLAATVVIPGTEFRGEVITAQRGVIYGGQEYNGNTVLQYFDTGSRSFQGGVTPIVGTGNSSSGSQTFWLKKWTDPVIERNLVRAWTSRTSWIDIRYGEILLNYAEASFELGNDPAEALDAVNQIRTRAGMPLHTSIDRQKIRHERRVELSFENKTYWDYVRWRTLTTEFNVRQLYGLDIYYDVDAGDYVFKKVPVYGGKTYQDRDYYFQIPGSERALNTALVDNPGY